VPVVYYLFRTNHRFGSAEKSSKIKGELGGILLQHFQVRCPASSLLQTTHLLFSQICEHRIA
jgi:hypothetical protein